MTFSVMLDVAIGLLLLFLISSMAASAIVEGVAGFLHRRSKNLWDTIDYLLVGGNVTKGRIVDQLYQQPGVKALVRPTDRVFFNPERADGGRKSAPWRARFNRSDALRPGRAGAPGTPARATAEKASEQIRRYYGPKWIEPDVFATALTGVVLADRPPEVRLVALEAAINGLDDDEVKAKLNDFLTEARQLVPREGAAEQLLTEIREKLDSAPEAATLREIYDRELAPVLDLAGTPASRMQALLIRIDDVADEALRTRLAGYVDGFEDRRKAGFDVAAEVLARIERSIHDLADGPARSELIKTFAESLTGVLRPGGTAEEILEEIQSWIRGLPDGDLKDHLLLSIEQSASSLAELQQSIAGWYEQHMTAVSSWYRKQTRWFLFIAGVILAGLGNLNAIGAAATLYRDDAVREAVVAAAIEVGAADCANEEAEFEECAAAAVDDLQLPIVGWGDVDRGDTGAWIQRLLGWITVGAAVTLGAPFWYDLLRRALDVRSKSEARTG